MIFCRNSSFSFSMICPGERFICSWKQGKIRFFFCRCPIEHVNSLFLHDVLALSLLVASIISGALVPSGDEVPSIEAMYLIDRQRYVKLSVCFWDSEFHSDLNTWEIALSPIAFHGMKLQIISCELSALFNYL